jgi:hypothetical protein
MLEGVNALRPVRSVSQCAAPTAADSSGYLAVRRRTGSGLRAASVWVHTTFSKVCRAERSEGTASACPDDIAAGTCLQARWRRRLGRVVVSLNSGRPLGAFLETTP